MEQKKNWIYAMLCGMLGCLCYGGGDWLMMYGDSTCNGTLFWLTDGVADIPAWRNTLAMVLAFPGIIFYGVALFALQKLILEKKKQKRYRILTIVGLTPWIALHLLYIMVLYLYAWLQHHGYAEEAVSICEALYQHFSWVIVVSEVFMLPPFLYWFWLVLRKCTILPKAMALVNPLSFYLIFYCITLAFPNSAFKVGFTNGLMSESMILCFILWAIVGGKKHVKESI